MTPATLAGGRYTVERELGRGGMAVVVLAPDATLERPVAVKLLSESAAADAELRERFLREGRFAAKLAHANVVAVYDTGEDAGTPYIVMECVPGESLAELVRRRGALPPEEVVELGLQACAGLEHAHARGLVHRDVKPQNLLLRDDGTLKVADFGIARSGGGSATLTQAGTLLGTASYMAPEVVEGEPATAASDLYSLGAVLYELVTGSPPRQAATIADLTLDERVRPPSEVEPGVPAGLEAAILRCLERDPARRPASARALADELRGADAPTLSQRPTEVVRTAPRFDNRVAVALVALVAAFVLVMARAIVDDDPPTPPTVEPVPATGTPAQDARSLAEWLRENSG